MVKFNISSISHSQSGWAEDKMFAGCLLAYIKKDLNEFHSSWHTDFKMGRWAHWDGCIGRWSFMREAQSRSVVSQYQHKVIRNHQKQPKKANATLKPFRSQTFSKHEPPQQHLLVHTVGLERQSMPQQPPNIIRGWYSISRLCKQTAYTNWSSC